jgi:hypothetical protein
MILPSVAFDFFSIFRQSSFSAIESIQCKIKTIVPISTTPTSIMSKSPIPVLAPADAPKAEAKTEVESTTAKAEETTTTSPAPAPADAPNAEAEAGAEAGAIVASTTTAAKAEENETAPAPADTDADADADANADAPKAETLANTTTTAAKTDKVCVVPHRTVSCYYISFFEFSLTLSLTYLFSSTRYRPLSLSLFLSLVPSFIVPVSNLI